jgi:hypothetical protein
LHERVRYARPIVRPLAVAETVVMPVVTELALRRTFDFRLLLAALAAIWLTKSF